MRFPRLGLTAAVLATALVVSSFGEPTRARGASSPAAETECAQTMSSPPTTPVPAIVPGAPTARRADAVLRQVTSRMSEGPAPEGGDDNGLSVEQLVALYDQGERLYIQCNPQAKVAQAILARHGIRSRAIGTLAAEGPWDYMGDSHMLLEVWTGRHWIAYDPDGNRQPVDARGHAMGALRAARTRPFHWRYIASDSYIGAFPSCSFELLDAAADHAMGIVAIQTGPVDLTSGYVYHVGPALRARVEDYGIGWTWVGKRRWAKLTRGEK